MTSHFLPIELGFEFSTAASAFGSLPLRHDLPTGLLWLSCQPARERYCLYLITIGLESGQQFA